MIDEKQVSGHLSKPIGKPVWVAILGLVSALLALGATADEPTPGNIRQLFTPLVENSLAARAGEYVLECGVVGDLAILWLGDLAAKELPEVKEIRYISDGGSAFRIELRSPGGKIVRTIISDGEVIDAGAPHFWPHRLLQERHHPRVIGTEVKEDFERWMWPYDVAEQHVFPFAGESHPDMHEALAFTNYATVSDEPNGERRVVLKARPGLVPDCAPDTGWEYSFDGMNGRILLRVSNEYSPCDEEPIRAVTEYEAHRLYGNGAWIASTYKRIVTRGEAQGTMTTKLVSQGALWGSAQELAKATTIRPADNRPVLRIPELSEDDEEHPALEQIDRLLDWGMNSLGIEDPSAMNQVMEVTFTVAGLCAVLLGLAYLLWSWKRRP